MPIGNNGFPAGEWVFSGQFVVSDSASGDIQVHLLHARAENLCDTLS